MANNFHPIDKIANEALMLLENELVMGKKVHTDFSNEYSNNQGDTITIRKPAQYLGQQNNLDVTSYNEDITQGTTTIKMDQTISIPITLTAMERTLSFDRLSEDVIKPAVVRMKDVIESKIAATYPAFYWFAGSPGTVPATFKAVGEVGAIMTDAGIPMSGRFAAHNTTTALELADGLKGVFVQDKVRTALEQVSLGRYANADHYEWVHAPVHVVGAHGGVPLVDGANQDVDYVDVKDTWQQSLVTNGWTNSTTGILKAGDIITLGGVFAVNPVSKQSTGRLQTFTVLADANSGASTGPATLTISPPIITSGAYQTVSAAPDNDAPIVVKTGTAGTSRPQSLFMHPKAIALVTRPLDIPQGQGVKTATKTGNQMTISVSEYMSGDTLKQRMRFDVLYGVKVLDPRLGARLTA